jgi:transposase-like protein
MKQRKQYTKESKQKAIRLVTQQGRFIADAANTL